MDIQMVNTLLFAALGLAIAIIVLMLIGRSRALDRENLLTGKLNEARGKVLRADEDKNYAEGKLQEEHDKLEKIHLLKFSTWLFDDEEFVAEISTKVDELRPAALERYNAKQQEEMRLQSERNSEAMKRFQESVVRDQESSKAKIVGGFTGIDGSVAIVTSTMISSDTTSSFSGGDSCSVDSSCM